MEEYAGAAFIPVIVGIVEVLKRIGLKDRFAPITSIIIGIVLGILYGNEGDIKKGVLQGVYFGLAATGLYSGTKNVVGEIRR